MHVRNTTGVDQYVAATQETVEAGETVEVEHEVGERLVDQGWTSAVQIAAKRRGREQRKAAAEAPEETVADEAPDEPAEPEPNPADPATPQED